MSKYGIDIPLNSYDIEINDDDSLYSSANPGGAASGKSRWHKLAAARINLATCASRPVCKANNETAFSSASSHRFNPA